MLFWCLKCSKRSVFCGREDLLLAQTLTFLTRYNLSRSERCCRSRSTRIGLCGSPFSSVGRAGVPFAEALSSLQRTWFDSCACHSPSLSHPVPCHLFSWTINEAIEGQKKKKKRMGLCMRLGKCLFCMKKYWNFIIIDNNRLIDMSFSCTCMFAYMLCAKVFICKVTKVSDDHSELKILGWSTSTSIIYHSTFTTANPYRS